MAVGPKNVAWLIEIKWKDYRRSRRRRMVTLVQESIFDFFVFFVTEKEKAKGCNDCFLYHRGLNWSYAAVPLHNKRHQSSKEA